MSSQTSLGKIDRSEKQQRRLAVVRLLLALGWFLAAVGYFGPWIGHPTAALTLSGVDMGEFVKFLPSAASPAMPVIRLFFYLPPFALVVTVALLAGARRLSYPWLLQAVFVILAVPVSLQLLPPAWSPATLLSSEFCLQTAALAFSWLLLAGFRVWGRLSPWLAGGLSALLALAAAGLAAWQFWAVKPAIDEVYRRVPTVGWGFPVCLLGLLIVAAAGLLFLLHTHSRGGSYGR